MTNGDLNWIVGFIWNIADYVLRDVYVRGKYRDVILPMTVIRRLDAVLEPSEEAVLKLSKQFDDAGVSNKQDALCQTAGNTFYNISPFTLRDLRARAKQQRLKADFWILKGLMWAVSCFPTNLLHQHGDWPACEHNKLEKELCLVYQGC